MSDLTAMTDPHFTWPPKDGCPYDQDALEAWCRIADCIRVLREVQRHGQESYPRFADDLMRTLFQVTVFSPMQAAASRDYGCLMKRQSSPQTLREDEKALSVEATRLNDALKGLHQALNIPNLHTLASRPHPPPPINKTARANGAVWKLWREADEALYKVHEPIERLRKRRDRYTLLVKLGVQEGART